MNLNSRHDQSSTARSRSNWGAAVRWALIFLLALELFIRSFVIRLPPMEYKPEWGIVPVDGALHLQGREGFSVTRYLSNGEVWTPYEDPDAVSIVVMGDSTVNAVQVANAKNFVSITETALRQKGLRVDLHNLGRSMQSIADHVYLSAAVNEEFSPEIVVIQVNPSNFSLSFFRDRENYFDINEDGSVSLVHRPPARVQQLPLYNILNHSSLFALFDYRLSGWLHKNQAERDQMDARSGEGWPASARESFLVQARAVQQAFPESKIIFLVIPYTPSIAWKDGLKISWRSASDEEMAGTLSEIEGVTVISAQMAFRETYQRSGIFPRGSFNYAFNYGHLNEQGHLAVAGVLADALEQVVR